MGFFDFLRPRPKNLPPLRLHNTLGDVTEEFKPLGRTVKMYNCGPTVYDEQHAGNLRGPVLADVLRRTLIVWGYPVAHVSNITDVGHLTSDADEGEDKIEASAKARGKSAQEIAQEITEKFFADLDALNINRSVIRFPRATEYIAEQIDLIKRLEKKGYTYTIGDGVYFDTGKFPAYGKLGNMDLAGERAGARVEENKEKRSSHDFALWKFSPRGAVRQQEWPSPWGVGFPGWHLECTAMIFALLGEQIDIHIGGRDLAPIHHNNEIAQAEAATGKQFVRYWLHNEFITIDSKKVSKSIGNTVYLREFGERGISPMALRYWYLTGHYRTPMNFTWDALAGADQALKRLTRGYLEAPALAPSDSHIKRKENAAAPTQRDAMSSSEEVQRHFLEAFYAALANDLDTPKALALVWENLPSLDQKTLRDADNVLGLGLAEVRPAVVPDEVQKLVDEREEARKNKDFTKADELRTKVKQAGFEIHDTPEGPKVTEK